MSNLIRTLCSILLCLLVFSTEAIAQDRLDSAAYQSAVTAEKENAPPKKAPGGMFLGLKGVVTQLGGTMSQASGATLSTTLFNGGLAIGKGTLMWAKGLAASLAILYFVVEGISFASGKNPSLKASVVEIAIPVAFCSYLLLNYDKLIADFCGQNGLLAYVRTVGNNPADALMKFYGQIMTTVVNAITDAGTTYVKTWSIAAPLDTATALVDLVVTILFALGIALVALMGLAEVLGLILVGPFLTAVGVALGPIFIACIVTPWTREYFTKWIGFVVSASLLTGVIGICVQIATTLFDTFNFGRFAGTSDPTAMTMLLALIILATVNSLIAQAPAIASALVPGSTGASKGGGGHIGGAAKHVGKRMKNSAGGVKTLLSKTLRK
jgi:type IV secretory pathway VirB6-like protein